VLFLAIAVVASMSLIVGVNVSGAGRSDRGNTPTALPAGLPESEAIDRNSLTARRSTEFGSLPLYFVENRGQFDKRVSYYVPGRDKTIYFTSEGLTFTFGKRGSDGFSERWALKLDFVGANLTARPEGIDQADAVFSYLSGPREDWKTGVRSYARIVYRDLWPGIDLVYSGTVNRMKYSFTVKPGADASRIRLAYRGASSVRVNHSGELEVESPLGGFHDESPVSLQQFGKQPASRQKSIKTAYRIVSSEDSGRVVYGFQLGDYDRSRELVIDPAVLVYCGFIGGGGDDVGNAIAVDGSGNAYVVGETSSSQATFPVVAGFDLTYSDGPGDAFIAKVNAAGTSLVYCSYIGGSNNDRATGVAVDGPGNAYVVGETFSNQTTFPIVGGPGLTYARNGDVFIAKVNAAGTSLIYSGYIGGDQRDFASGVAIDSSGNAYVVGYTGSNELSFPVTVGPDISENGDIDAFVAKVNTTGTALVYCGYIGGIAKDYGRGIAVDVAGNAYVAGDTASNQTSFPVTGGPDLTYNGGDSDAFVAKINAAGTALVYSGYVGGTGVEFGRGMAVDSAGNAYITGETSSDQASFPVTVGPDLTFNGLTDAFVSKLNPSGTGFVYSGYIGGTGNDAGYGIAVDSGGSAYVTGETSSFQTSFPVVGGPQLQGNGVLDAFVTRLNPPGNSLIYSGFLGGSGNDRANSIAIDGNGNAYVTGTTESHQPTFPATVGPDITFNGGMTDAFVAKIERRTDVTPPTIASVGAVSRSQGSSTSITLAFVSDVDTIAGNIFVGLKNIPAGVSVSNLVNNNGTVTATVVGPCGTSPGAYPVTIEATDGAGLKSTADVTINVTANTAPVLGTYPATDVPVVGVSATVTPSAAPTDNGSITTIVATASPGFAGTLNVNTTTGVISIANAGPRERYTVTVTATDNCQATSSTAFVLSVGQPNPVPTLTSVTPNIIAVRTQGTTLTVRGEGFLSDAKVLWNDSVRATTFVSDKELTAVITTQDLATIGTATVAVQNPAPGGGKSGTLLVSIVNTVAMVNAASFALANVGLESIVAGFGTNLGTAVATAGTFPLPTELAGTRVTVRDAAGTERLAPLFFVGPTQVNFQMPPGTVLGLANVTVRNSAGVVSIGSIPVTTIGPGIFTALANGRGVPAANILRVRNGVGTFEPVARFDLTTGTFVPLPIDFGPETDQLFLVLYGTGIRFATATNRVVVQIGGVTVPTAFAGPQGQFTGVDQINAGPLPRSLAGRGEVDVVVIVDTVNANTVRVAFR
jgi:uncharacterized protein (TIGR03437 family)